MRGVIGGDGALTIDSFSRPYSLGNLSEVERLAAVRKNDVEQLIQLAPHMLTGMSGEYWKFRMAVHFYVDGFFAAHNWKTRFFYRCTALEAVFSSKRKQGSALAKGRILEFLGRDTQLYSQGEIPDWLPQAQDITVLKVLDAIYEARNTIAHGDRLPDSFFTEEWRGGVNGSLTKREVLDEAVCSLVRRSLMKIMSQNLLEHFASSDAADNYFLGVDAQTLKEKKARKRSAIERSHPL